MHRAGVTFVLDRAGVTGPDGASHHGMWDMTIAAVVPGLRLNAPRDGQSVRLALREAVDIDDGPSVIRFPKGTLGAPIDAIRRVGSVDVVADHTEGRPVDLLLVAVGSMVPCAMTVAQTLAAEGQSVLVVDPRWVIPVGPDLLALAQESRTVAVIEDNIVVGGVGSQIALALRENAIDVPVRTFGIPRAFLDHATRGQVLDHIGLTPEAIATALSRSGEHG